MSRQHGDPDIYMHLLCFYILNLKPLLLPPAWSFPRLEKSLNLLNSALLLAGDLSLQPATLFILYSSLWHLKIPSNSGSFNRGFLRPLCVAAGSHIPVSLLT